MGTEVIASWCGFAPTIVAIVGVAHPPVGAGAWVLSLTVA